MSQLTLPPTLTPRKGSRGHIYRLLQDNAVGGVCTLSLEAIAELSGYCPATVKKSVRWLVTENHVRVTKLFGDRRNSYLLG